MYIKLINYINNCIKNNENFTVSLDEYGKICVPQYGYIVSITPLINVGMNIDEQLKYITLTKYINIEGNNYKLYLGGWFNKNKLYTDISINLNRKEEAIQIGKHCNQNAIYNINNRNIICIK